MKLSSDQNLDYNFATIEHYGDKPYFISGVAPLMRVTVRNLTLIIKGNPKYVFDLKMMRESVFKNINIIYEGSIPEICTSIIRLKAKERGCHYNVFSNIKIRANGVRSALQVFNSDERCCNDNHFSSIFAFLPSHTGFDVRGCKGNTFSHVSAEGRRGSEMKYGIRFRDGSGNSAHGYYIENCNIPTWTNEPVTKVNKIFYGGYEYP